MPRFEINVPKVIEKQIVEAKTHYEALRKAGARARKLGGTIGRPPGS